MSTSTIPLKPVIKVFQNALRFSVCALNKPCRNGGTCSVGLYNDIKCRCTDGYAGPFCNGEYLNHVSRSMYILT